MPQPKLTIAEAMLQDEQRLSREKAQVRARWINRIELAFGISIWLAALALIAHAVCTSYF